MNADFKLSHKGKVPRRSVRFFDALLAVYGGVPDADCADISVGRSLRTVATAAGTAYLKVRPDFCVRTDATNSNSKIGRVAVSSAARRSRVSTVIVSRKRPKK